MRIRLDPPRSLGGFTLGDTIGNHDMSAFHLDFDVGLDPDEMSDVSFLFRHTELDFRGMVIDGIVVSVGSGEECWLGASDLIGMRTSEAIQLIGLGVVDVDRFEISIYTLEQGVEVWERDGYVTRVIISDPSLINE